MNLRTTMILLLAVASISTAVAANGEDSATNGAAKGETIINLNGTGMSSKAQFVSGMVETIANNVYFIMLREPQTGYTWWQEEYRPKNDFSSSLEVRDSNEFGKSFWVVSEIGIVRLMGQRRLELTAIKTTSIADAERQLIAGIKTGKSNTVWPLNQHQKEIILPLMQPLGRDFYYIPMVAMPPPPPKVLALGFTNGTWSINLESSVAKTNRVAVVELDSDFKVLKATRSNL